MYVLLSVFVLKDTRFKVLASDRVGPLPPSKHQLFGSKIAQKCAQYLHVLSRCLAVFVVMLMPTVLKQGSHNIRLFSLSGLQPYSLFTSVRISLPSHCFMMCL